MVLSIFFYFRLHLLRPVMITCKNCQEEVTLHYCPNCGQKATVDRITLSGLLYDLPHAIFHVDRGFLYNFRQLFKGPGEAIRNYLGGKRKYFFHPASYLVISLVLNYLIVKLTDLHFYDEHELVSMDPVKAKAIQDYDSMQWWFLEHTYIYILIAIPVSALFVFLLFRLTKHTFNIAESAVVVLFTIAQGVLIQTLIYLSFGWIKSGPFLRVVEMVNMSILIFYASFVIYQLLTSVRGKFVRGLFSLIGGAGLAVVWIASAYVLYLMLTNH
jgi:hypothetical protein